MHDLRRAALYVLGLLFLLTCSTHSDAPVLAHAVYSMVDGLAKANLSAMQTEADPEEDQATVLSDPFAGWQNWCEPTFYESQCKVDSDCKGQAHPSHRGAPFRCLHPWWAENDKLKICAPAGASKTERRWRYARLRELVSELYFDEREHCDSWIWEMTGKPGQAKRFERVWADGSVGVHQQHWRCQREWRAAERLTDFLWIPYKRETTGRPFKRHRLNPDEQANKMAYVRQASAYGWVVDLKCEVQGRSVERCPKHRSGRLKAQKRIYIADVHPDPEAEHQNPYYGDRWRWEYGLGPLGQNTALGVQDWDPMAPPEILCLEPVGIEAWLRDVRTAVRRYRNGGVICDGERYRGRALRPEFGASGEQVGVTVVEEPSLFDVHRVAAAGAWCPKKGQRAAKMRMNLHKQLAARGINAEHSVTEDMFGRELPREGQWERAQQVLEHLDAVLPSPWETASPALDPEDQADSSTGSTR